MAADYHTDTPHILDYNKYPGKSYALVHSSLSSFILFLCFDIKYIDLPLIGIEERKRFVRVYLSSSGNVFYESLCL